MILKYEEIKEAVQDSYSSLHDDFNYTPKETLYATIGDYENFDSFGLTDECCIYVNFALKYLEKEIDIDFMKPRLLELINKELLKKHITNLSDDSTLFIKDVQMLKSKIGSND